MVAGAAQPSIDSAFAALVAGDLAGAIGQYRAMIALSPGNPQLHYSLGQLLLLSGDYAAGWEECERRVQRLLPLQRWRGEPLKGAGIVIHGEQGFGDNFQFVRYAPMVAERGGRVIVATREGLRPLLATVPGVSQVIEAGEDIVGALWQVPMLSLPYLFATRLESMSSPIPYVAADTQRVAAWRARLAPVIGLRVGVVWSGNTEAQYNARRSPGLTALRPLFDAPGVAFFGLQLGGGRAELAGADLSANFTDLAPQLTSFDDTAAAMMALDLVITPCTSTAHLAGALGRPAWVMLARAPDWRWGFDGETTPWYPTARLFRQPWPDDWATPIAHIRAELVKAASGGC